LWKRLFKETDEQLVRFGRHGCGVFRVGGNAGAMIGDLQSPIWLNRETIPTGVSDVGSPRWKTVRQVKLRIIRLKVIDGLANALDCVTHPGEQCRCPRTGCDDHGVGANLSFRIGPDSLNLGATH
jgi:hypothetical protein